MRGSTWNSRQPVLNLSGCLLKQQFSKHRCFGFFPPEPMTPQQRFAFFFHFSSCDKSAPENLTFKTCGMNFMCHNVYGKMPFPENMLFTVKLGKLFYNPVFDFRVLSPLQHPKVGCAASTVPQKCFPPGRKNDSVTLFLHLVNLIANPVFHRGGGKLLQKSPVEQTTPTTSSLDQTMWLVFKMIHVYI